jgi:hypothetical protein
VAGPPRQRSLAAFTESVLLDEASVAAGCPGRTNAARNRGDAIILVDGIGRSIDQAAYKADVLRAGRTICFAR